jgi:hypothetical protein
MFNPLFRQVPVFHPYYNPFLFLIRDCKPEMQMMYAGTKLALVEQVYSYLSHM